MGFINFVYKIENAKGGKCNYGEGGAWQNSSDNLDFLGVGGIKISEGGGDYDNNNIKN